jgi:hypothetical protein
MNLYGRQHELESSLRALRRDDRVGVWVRGSRQAGQASFAHVLAHRYLATAQREEPAQPWASIQFNTRDVPEPERTCDHYREWLSQQILDAQGQRYLLLLADLDTFSPEEQAKMAAFLAERVPKLGWKAIVCAAPGSRPALQTERWECVDLNERLSEYETQAYVMDYMADHVRDDRLAPLQDLWQLARIYRQTGGRIDALHALLEEVRWSGQEVPAVLDSYEETPATADTAGQEAGPALLDLSAAHLRVLKVLSLAATSVPKKLLAYVLPNLSNELDAVIAQLVDRALIEREVGLDESRYALSADQRQAIRGRCTADDPPFAAFLAWWQEYVRQNQARHDLLVAEHANLLGLLDQLWQRAEIPSDEPLPMEAFEMIPEDAEERRRAARACIELNQQLYPHWRRAGKWLDCRHAAARAYAAACALRNQAFLPATAYQAAITCVVEGDCLSQDLALARKWVTCMEEGCDRAGYAPSSPAPAARSALGLAARMRGVIAMRCHDYQTSSRCLREAESYLLPIPPDVPPVSPDLVADLYDLLAKLEMRDSPTPDAHRRYAQCNTWIDKGLGLVAQEEECRAMLLSRQAELETWWGNWDQAGAALGEALRLAKSVGRTDLQAKGCYLDALVCHAYRKQQGPGRTLDDAIARAQEALALLESAADDRRSILWCSTHLLIAALYYERHEPQERIGSHIQRAGQYLETRPFLAGTASQLTGADDAEASYEAACLAHLSGQTAQARAHLDAARAGSPGLAVRARNDFRLAGL